MEGEAQKEERHYHFYIQTTNKRNAEIIEYYCKMLNIKYKQTILGVLVPELILEIILKEFGTTKEKITAINPKTRKISRKREVLLPRQFYYYFSMKYCSPLSKSNISYMLGQDHATCYNSQSQIENQLYIGQIKYHHDNIDAVIQTFLKKGGG